ncbi:hypothetical protein JTB14_014727 [Gonioctena quinquepunctata]|nr:hypothetical protein JTB14_014727 [Gonioctena quinquepunctata]
MRLLGVGFYGLLNFCGLMDISATALSITGYYKCIEQVYIALKAVSEIVLKKAAKEEQEKNKERGLPEDRLTVSGDEFDAWFTEHCEAGNCTRDHDGSAGLIEVEGVEDMFRRSVEQYGVMYEYYIGDGDSKTFKRLEESEPYGEAVKIKKKACVLHECSYLWIPPTDAKPQHQYCPAGADSWCAYQKAVATKQNYNHPPAFDQEIQDLLQPIYEELTDEKLLERCLGANTQNNNESYNSCVWNIAPKHKFVGKKTLEIAALSAACIFNEGLLPILKVMEVMGVRIGPEARHFADRANNRRVDRSELEATEASKEHRTAVRNARILQNDAYEDQEGVVYEAGMDI